MIKGRSALESLTMFGLANDGPLNKGGLGVKPQAPPEIPGVTTADKLVATPKPIKAKERKGDANISDANKKALRDAKYKEAHAEALKAKARERMAKKRAESKGKA